MHKPPLLTCSSNPTASTFSRIVRAGCAAALAMMTVGAAPASAAPLRGSAPASPLVLAPQAGAVPTPEVCFATIDGINVYSSVNANALQQAVDAAAPGATVKVAGLCAGVQNRASTNQSVYISKTLTLEGGYSPSNWIVSDPMNNSTVIDAQAVGRLIFATAPVTLSQLTLQNGSAGVGNDGGAVFVAPAATAITISATQILSSTAGRSGGGIAISGTTASRVSAVFIDTTLRANSAVTNGGGIVASTNTTVTLNNAQVITNSAGQVGGGAFLDGRVEDSGSTFMRNYAAGSAVNRGGGGLYARSATLTNTQFLTNTATHSGGGLIMLDELVMNGGLFQGNQAFRAGGLYGQRNNWTLTGTQFIANSAMGNGGGAAYFNNSGGTQFVTLNNVWVERNTSDNFAGGLFINSPNTTFINGSTFLSNTAPNVGAISTGSGAANGMLLIYGNRFEGNQSTAQAAGAVQSSRPASTVISKTAFLRNTAATDAGAVQVTSGRAEFVNNLFAGNTAGSNLGAAAWLSSTGVFTLWHNTFAGAAPNAGSAVHVVNGNTQLRNNILASYTTGINVVAGSSSEDNNLFDNVTTPRAGIAAGANSVTGAASFNAPASDDFKFTPSSQAIDMGASLGVNEDFFGNPRPQQAAPDAGYFESPFVPLLACNAEINGDNVTDFSSNNAQAVRDAVAAVAVDGTVKVAGTCAGAVAQSGSTQVVLITQTLTLEGGYTATNWLASSDPIANPSTLDALAGGRVIYATVPVTVTNLTVQNGNTNESGGGGFFGSTVTLTGTRFISNTAAQPGGGARVQGVATLNGGLFENNTASQGGGLFANSTLALTKTQFISNTAVVEGGGARVNGAAMLNGGVFQNNTSEDGGGAWFGSSVVLSGTIFLSNTAPYEGGGARVAGAATIHGGRFENNRSTNSSGGIGGGGGLFAESTLTLTGTVFISNTAVYAGGGAHVNGTATLTGGRFENNRSIESFGGGLLAASTLTLTGTTFLSNTAAASGGGAAAFGAATLNGGWFENNISASGGGGLLAGNTLALTGTTFMSNTATDGGGARVNGAATLNGGRFENNRSTSYDGGGLFANSTLALTGTTFLSNTAALNGGGAFAVGPATLNGGWFENNRSTVNGGALWVSSSLALTCTGFISNTAQQGGGLYLFLSAAPSRIVNSLFARNTASTGNGDALFLHDPEYIGGTVEVIHSTIASPTLSSGTAIAVGTGTVNITNTLIASHTVGISQTGSAVVNSDYNLFYGNVNDVAGSVVTGSNSVIGDPAFVDAAGDNYRLTVNSFAAERGIDLGIANDFNGNGRPFGPQVDIGAFELQATNESPIADAGAPQTVVVNDLVTLDGTDSSDPEGQSLTFGWSQISGTPVVLNDDSSMLAQFTAPAIAGTLVFQLVVTDSVGLPSAPAFVTVTVEEEPITEIPPDGAVITLTTGNALLQPTKDFTVTLGEGSEPITFVWDFGDGSPIYTGPVASHVYAPGVYTATLTATNSAGTVTTTIVVFVPWRILLSIMVKDSTLPLWLQGR